VSEPAQRRRRVGFVVVVVLTLVWPFLAPIGALDLAIFDAGMRYLRRSWPRPSPAPVVIVGIDEGTYQKLAEPLALWHRHLGRLLTATAAGRPRVVGLDVTLPARSYDFLVPGQDRALLQGILELKRAAPLVLGITVDATGGQVPVHPPFLSVAGPESMGFVQWRLDPDRVVRRFSERLADDGSSVPTLVGQMARQMGVEPSEGLIDFSIGDEPTYIPLQDVLAWHASGDQPRLRAAFEGSSVLVGTVLPFVDRHLVPVDLAPWDSEARYLPGVLLHAQALRSLLGPGLIQPTSPLWPLGLSLVAAFLWWLGHRPVLAGAGLLALWPLLLVLTTGLLYRGQHLPIGAIAVTATVAVAGRAGLELAERAWERSRLRRAFSGYVSPGVLEEILAGRLLPGTAGERRHVCVLFADIRGFTGLSEGMRPEEIISLLNRYFAAWATVIQGLDGTIDKFLGDGIMAFFGAPKPSENPCRQAFGAARQMLDRLQELNRELAREGRPTLRIGVGLHAGEVVVGHVGPAERNEYTAIGDVVNLASRLEGLTKETGHRVVCSRTVVDALPDEAGFVSLGRRSVRGRHAPVELFGWTPPERGAAPAASKNGEKA
jgi:class 3 adenylate cyclase